MNITDRSSEYAAERRKEIIDNKVQERIKGHTVEYVQKLFPKFKFRVNSIDGESFAVFQDYRTDRINVDVSVVGGIEVINYITFIG
jgi:hypothetical protein